MYKKNIHKHIKIFQTYVLQTSSSNNLTSHRLAFPLPRIQLLCMYQASASILKAGPRIASSRSHEPSSKVLWLRVVPVKIRLVVSPHFSRLWFTLFRFSKAGHCHAIRHRLSLLNHLDCPLLPHVFAVSHLFNCRFSGFYRPVSVLI